MIRCKDCGYSKCKKCGKEQSSICGNCVKEIAEKAMRLNPPDAVSDMTKLGWKMCRKSMLKAFRDKLDKYRQRIS